LQAVVAVVGLLQIKVVAVVVGPVVIALALPNLFPLVLLIP
jgi:hypothetical protein